MQPTGQFDADSLIGEARTIALDTAKAKGIFLSPEALAGVDLMVQDRIGSIKIRFAEGTLDFEQWRAIVQSLAGLAAKQILNRGVKRLNTPRDLVSTVNATLKLYPFDC
jgi:hypothetical protein